MTLGDDLAEESIDGGSIVGSSATCNSVAFRTDYVTHNLM